jgi:signal transduction histidine kinase
VGKRHSRLADEDSAADLAALYDRAVDDRNQLESLLAVTSHELRHPLHLMRLALVRFFPRGDEHARQVIERYIDRMARVVGDMGDLVRLEHNTLPLMRARVDLTQILRDVVDAFFPDAAARRVKLTLEMAASPQWLDADEQRLLQVFSNVVDNAIKFTPSDGSILVSVTRSGSSVEVRVKDTGRGISTEQLPRVFDLYATAAAPHGMGVGLTVARRVVELHGGSITVRSEGLDRGTEVIVLLPAKESDGFPNRG